MSAAGLDMSHDWIGRPLPENIEVGENCFIQSAYVFGLFRSRRAPGLVMGAGSGLYSQSQLVVGERGLVTLGPFACLNSATIQCEQQVTIGAHCLLAWGVVISDCLIESGAEIQAGPPDAWQRLPACPDPAPVVLEDNVWVGFGSVILPGVTIGEGSIIGSRSVIREDVPAYTVIAGDPAVGIRSLTP